MKLKYFLGIVAALIVQWGAAWAQSGPVMNEVYTVPMENFSGQNSFLIPPSAFLEDATSAVVTVKDFGSWGILRKGAFTSDNFASNVYGVLSVSYEFSGADLKVAQDGNLFINCDANENTTVTVLNKDANYVAPSPGPGGNGGNGGTNNPDPNDEPDYTNQQDTDGDGILDPDATHKAFGALIDYNVYRQQTEVPTIYLSTTETIDFTNKTETYYEANIVVVDKNGTMKQRNETVTFRGRGNASWDNQNFKKPWRLKFPAKTDLLAELDGNYQEVNNYANAKSWTLLANYFDKSQIRNALTTEVGKMLGLEFCPAYKFVDLMLKDATTDTYKYVGCYQVSDHVQVDKKRVNVNSSTGWFLEANSGKRSGFLEAPYFYANCGSTNMGVNIKNPEIDVLSETDVTSYVNNEDYKTIKAWVEKVGGLAKNLTKYNYDDEDNYRNYIDMESAINAFIGMDLTGNYDGVVANNYAYKEAEDQKLKFGPLWDMDLAWDNYEDMNEKHFWEGENQPFGYIVMNLYNNDPRFVKALCERWRTIYDNGNLVKVLKDKVDMLAGLVAPSATKNFTDASWGYSGNLSVSSQTWAENRSYSSLADTYTAIKSFIETHVAFLNESYEAQYVALDCASVSCSHTYNKNKYTKLADGTYARVCDSCDETEENGKAYYKFTVYPESVESTETFTTDPAWAQTQDVSAKPNTIFVVEAANIPGTNVVSNGICSELVLTDGHPYYCKEKFTAISATYTRSISSSIGTVCLPYKQQNAKITGAKLYHISSIDNDKIVLKLIDPETEGNASAYVPVIFVAEQGTTSLTFTGEDVTVKKISALKPYSYEAEGWSIVGTMETKIVNATNDPNFYYYFSGGKLYRAESTFTNNPFRAYFQSTENIFSSGPSNARMRIVTEDELGIQTIISEEANWDDAIRVSTLDLPLPAGHYVINGRNVIISK